MSIQVQILHIPKEVLKLDRDQHVYLYRNMTWYKKLLFVYKNFILYQNIEDAIDLKPYKEQIKEYLEQNYHRFRI